MPNAAGSASTQLHHTRLLASILLFLDKNHMCLHAQIVQIGDYWGWFGKRFYHHTGPVSTFYAMREAMALVAEEGLESMWCVCSHLCLADTTCSTHAQ